MLDTLIEELFPHSLDEPRNLSPADQTKKKSGVPRIHRINMRKNHEGESSDAAIEKVPKLTIESSPAKPQANELSKEIVVVAAVGKTKVGTSSAAIDLTRPTSGRVSQSRHPQGKHVAGGGTSSIEEGSNKFPDAEGEVIFTPVSQDTDKIRLLETRKGFHSSLVATCLVSKHYPPSR